MLDYLRSLMKPHEKIPFVDFMHHALYAPNLGYYSADRTQLGTHGDFITAPELTPLFGATLAHACRDILKSLEHPHILEFGAGTGRLCVDVMKALERLDSLPCEYLILEVSASLKVKQQALILKEIPTLASRVRWLETWPDVAFSGVVLANEVLDAMPVHRFLKKDAIVFESMIGFNQHHELEETFEPCTNKRLIHHVEQVLGHVSTPYCSEVNLFIDSWLKQCYRVLTQGAVILIDYGFPQHEYYHPDRHQGTLMCHHQHRAHARVLEHPGEQDITAHVDFTHVAEAASNAGFHVAGFTNQASFLLAHGLLDLMQAMTDARSLLKAQQAVKLLLQPSEMGELFKVMMLTKNLDGPWVGFQSYDKRASL